ncbi:MAG: CHAT domain-containing protein, partial [Acidobacteria bacterium]|nr:CHAT domain-containing protein [Acidobacteriota bacterium]
RYREAIPPCQESLEIQEKNTNRSGISRAQRVLALAHSALGDHSLAIEEVEKAINAARDSKDRVVLREALKAAGTVFRASGQTDKARNVLDSSIEIIEKMGAKVPVSGEVAPKSMTYQYSPYTLMVELSIEQNQLEDAINYAEQIKARHLLDQLHDSNINLNESTSQADRQAGKKFVDLLVSLEMQMAREEYSPQRDDAHLTELKSQLQQSSVDLKALQARQNAEIEEHVRRRIKEKRLTIQDLSELIPDERTALLQYSCTNEQLSLLIATKSSGAVSLKGYSLKLRIKDISAGVDQLRQLIADLDQSSDLPRVASVWHAKLLKDAQSQLQGKRTLIIVPDGPLWEMPFQALKTPEGRYLLQDYAIFYAPSFSVLREMKKMHAKYRSTSSSRNLLAFGNPALGQSGKVAMPGALMEETLSLLPDAEKQVNQIRHLYGLQRSKVFTGNLATEEQFKALAPQFKILHLAAHGVFNERDPMRSNIVMSQTNKERKEDGLLEAREILKLKLHADLAVLSACETARGQLRAGEGLIGLPWALFIAGCPATVVSQWKVPSDSTADLMVAFHQRLNQKNTRVSKADALRRAALSLLEKKEYSHPFYWAGFVVVGSGY